MNVLVTRSGRYWQMGDARVDDFGAVADGAAVDDETLMSRVVKRGQEAFSLLLERHVDGLHSFVYRFLQSPAEAEDVVQETFLRVWSRAATWQPQRVRFSTWLYRIARNLCIDQLRRSRHQVAVDVEALSQPQPQQDHWVRAALRRAQAELPERQRSALILCHYQGLRNAEVAQVLGISVDAVESLLARARRSLKNKLAEYAP